MMKEYSFLSQQGESLAKAIFMYLLCQLIHVSNIKLFLSC